MERSRAERLCVSAGNGWSLGARGGARQAWLSRNMSEAWGVIAVAVLSKKVIFSCFSSCLERWQRGAGDDGGENRGRWASCVYQRDGVRRERAPGVGQVEVQQ